MITLIISLFIFAAFPVSSQVDVQPGTLGARMAIAPPRIEIDLPNNGLYNGDFSIVNVSDRPLDIALKITNWTLDENNNVQSIASTEQSLDSWLVINPLTFTIPPSSTQTVRYGIRPRTQPSIGEHRAMVYIKELPGDYQAENSGITFRLTYGLPIYANVGQINRAVTVHQAKLIQASAKPLSLSLDIENKGDFYARLKGKLGFWLASEYPGDKLADQALTTIKGDDQANLPNAYIELINTAVLPHTRRILNNSINASELENGHYIARLNASIGSTELQKTLSLNQL